MEWIKARDRLPNNFEEVLMYAENKQLDDYNSQIFVGSVYNTRLECVLGDNWTPFYISDLIAWMPLPEKPKD